MKDDKRKAYLVITSYGKAPSESQVRIALKKYIKGIKSVEMFHERKETDKI